MPHIKKFLKPCLLLSALLAAAVLPSAAARKAPAEPVSAVIPEAAPEIYTLRAVSGGVCIFSGEKAVAVADIDLSDMRDIDRDMFSRGVSVGSWEEALRLLEDFSS